MANRVAAAKVKSHTGAIVGVSRLKVVSPRWPPCYLFLRCRVRHKVFPFRQKLCKNTRRSFPLFFLCVRLEPPDEYFLHKICHTLQKIIQITIPLITNIKKIFVENIINLFLQFFFVIIMWKNNKIII